MNWGFFQFPRMDPAMPLDEISIVAGYVVPAGAPNRSQAGAFIRFMGVRLRRRSCNSSR